MSGAIKGLNKFLEKIDVPIVTTWSGIDTIDYYQKKSLLLMDNLINKGTLFSIHSKNNEKIALKALKIPGEIKKLSSSDTIHTMCELVDYIDLPEVVTKRDYDYYRSRDKW